MKKYKVSVGNVGNITWTIDKIHHREDGPAMLGRMNSGPFRPECWCLNGRFHREGGPARTDVYGRQEWFIRGERHREDGPAVENVYVPENLRSAAFLPKKPEWWFRGVQISKEYLDWQNNSYRASRV